ncbi:hypothetical protein ACUXAV_004547 [Cupriavidus metallidurans]|uniref:hypothetical protein n=1 Tax=Cupriavidus metallidurans TaxID=119219 RepID=UPI00049365F3|nr:hypothetical protein [Cupriavidus metallidurans]MDE4919566.1 hypothetical protein [Cupriavidus metallidurans]
MIAALLAYTVAYFEIFAILGMAGVYIGVMVLCALVLIAALLVRCACQDAWRLLKKLWQITVPTTTRRE